MQTLTIRSYVAIGDSLSEGVSDWGRGDRSIGFAARLAGLLSQTTSEFQFTNLGTGGARVADLLHRQADRAIAIQPDLLTVVVGANDVPTTPADQFARDYRALLTKLGAGVHGLIVVANIPNFAHLLPAQYAPYGALVTQRVQSLNQVIKEVAAHTNALLVDLQDAPETRDPRNVSSDGVHPNARGYRAITREFVRVLNSVGIALAPPELD